MPRAGLSPDAVVDAALAIVDEHGRDELTLAAVAQRVGVAVPSLYKHIRNLGELRVLITVRVLNNLYFRCAEAILGRSGDDAVRELMRAYRAYVLEYPARYEAMIQASDPRLSAAGGRLADLAFAALRGHGLEGPSAVHATRGLRSAMHGFVVIEAAGGFGLAEDVDASYEMLIMATIAGIHATAEAERSADLGRRPAPPAAR